MGVSSKGRAKKTGRSSGASSVSNSTVTFADGSKLNALLEISRALAGKLDLDHVLGVAIDVVARVIGADGASILLIDPETGGMSFHVAAGPGSDVAKTIPLPAGKGIAGHVAETGTSLIVNDAQNDPRLYRAVDQATRVITRNLLCVPVRSHERLWGVLELINKKDDRDFDDGDLQLAEVAAVETALALENAHLHREIVTKERMAAIGQTVSGLAHCIKNILNGIRSGSAVIDRSIGENDFEQVCRGWNIVRRNNGMLGNLVLDMLSLARDSKPHRFPTDVNDLAHEVCRLAEQQAAEKNINLLCHRASNLGDVLLDPTHFYRCLLNLVSNAVDACDEDARIVVRVYRAADKSRFTVSVTDNGPGISDANRQRLFTEFFTTKGGRGTGLGLAVTKKLVNEMNGTIKFHTAFGHGTRFVMALPIRSDANP